MHVFHYDADAKFKKNPNMLRFFVKCIGIGGVAFSFFLLAIRSASIAHHFSIFRFVWMFLLFDKRGMCQRQLFTLSMSM